MENDGKQKLLNIDNNNKQSSINIFNLEYENQTVKNNINFNKWKEIMNNKYEGKGEIYKCPLGNHYFYGIKKEDYSIFCQSCKKEFCYFCLTPLFDHWYAKCCTKRKLCIMHYNGKSYLKEGEDEGHFYNIEKEGFIFIIPGISFIFLIGIFFNAFFYKIVRKNYDEKNIDLTYEDHLRRKDIKYWILNIAINEITAVILVIPFLIFNIFISVLLLLIIIIWRKWYKYLLGFLHEDWYFLNKNLHKLCCCP